MTKASSVPYKLPARCAWCGSDKNLSLRPIKFSRNEVTGFYLVAYTMQFQNFKFSLPICHDCEIVLEKNRKKMILYSIVGGVLGGVGLVLYLLITNHLNDLIFGLPFSVAFGIFLGIVVGTVLFRKTSWGTIENGKLKFQNYQFQNEFDWLNPHLR